MDEVCSLDDFWRVSQIVEEGLDYPGLTEWEKTFLRGILERLEIHGEAIRLSATQLATLDDIETKLAADDEPVAAAALGITLNPDQDRALGEVEASVAMRRTHLLTGHAGSGKTTLIQVLAALHAGKKVVLCGPTHKACEVLGRKLRAAGIKIPVCTIHSLLSLRPKAQGARQIFIRHPKAPPVIADLVIIDEASMLDASMMRHIELWLAGIAVVFVGDPAQLPPVGEDASRCFATVPESHLHGIVRQAEGNPIIAASAIVRGAQGGAGAMDWSWTTPVRVGDTGVFAPGHEANAWLKHAFTSAAFVADPDTFRYLVWRNDRVDWFNARVRRWLGHDPAVPFVSGERALIRTPLIVNKEIILTTNEEVEVVSIAAGAHREIPTWETRVLTAGHDIVDIHIVRDWTAHKATLDMLAREAIGDDGSWEDFHAFKAEFVDARPLYALTTHNAQGSTFRHVFIDMAEFRDWIKRAPDEGEKGLYVAITRASHTVTLVGA
jgi:energy-coupling factor transporter ATP-binding protein EcfA2